MIEPLTRINLVGTHYPWWSMLIQFTEFKVLGGLTACETSKRLKSYNKYISELRHATMLEF